MTLIMVSAISFQPNNRFTPNFHQIDTKLIHLNLSDQFLKSRSTWLRYWFLLYLLNQSTDLRQIFTKSMLNLSFMHTTGYAFANGVTRCTFAIGMTGCNFAIGVTRSTFAIGVTRCTFAIGVIRCTFAIGVTTCTFAYIWSHKVRDLQWLARCHCRLVD